MKPKQRTPPKAPIHYMIATPIALRKEVLSAAIDTTRLLKEYEEYAALKAKKLKTIKYLAKEMRVIKTLSAAFNDYTFPSVPHQEPAPFYEQPQKKVLQTKPVLKPSTEVERLNKELQDIEAKLQSL